MKEKINVSPKTVRIIGTVTTILGALTSLVGSWVDNKQMEEAVNDCVTKALAERSVNNEQ